MNEIITDEWVHVPMDVAKSDPRILMLVQLRDKAVDTIEEINSVLSKTLDIGFAPPKPASLLTKNQHDALEWICNFFKKKKGLSPTSSELAEGMNYSNDNSAVVVINALHKKGYIDKTPHKWRSIVPLFTPDRKPITNTNTNAETTQITP